MKAEIVIVGAAIGTAQTFVLREFADKIYGPIIPGIGAWGNPSVVAGIGAGGIATILGVLGLLGKGPITSEDTIGACLSYGVPALIGGIFSALYPVTAPAPSPPTAGLKAPALVSPKVVPAKTVPAAPTPKAGEVLA